MYRKGGWLVIVGLVLSLCLNAVSSPFGKLLQQYIEQVQEYYFDWVPELYPVATLTGEVFVEGKRHQLLLGSGVWFIPNYKDFSEGPSCPAIATVAEDLEDLTERLNEALHNLKVLSTATSPEDIGLVIVKKTLKTDLQKQIAEQIKKNFQVKRLATCDSLDELKEKAQEWNQKKVIIFIGHGYERFYGKGELIYYIAQNFNINGKALIWFVCGPPEEAWDPIRNIPLWQAFVEEELPEIWDWLNFKKHDATGLLAFDRPIDLQDVQAALNEVLGSLEQEQKTGQQKPLFNLLMQSLSKFPELWDRLVVGLFLQPIWSGFNALRKRIRRRLS